MKKIYFLMFLYVLINISSAQIVNDSKSLTGAYLGQKPPGMTPELFAPGFLSTIAHEHSSPAFSPDGKEVYYSVFYPGLPTEVIIFRQNKNGVWSEPEVAPFSGSFRDGQPTFSTDGSKLFFCSMRPVQNEKKPTRMTLWCVDKNKNKWGHPYCLNAMVSSGNMEMTLTVAKNGNIYFSANDSIYGWTLYQMEFKNGIYSAPKSCGKLLGEEYAEWCPYIAPDESYMLFSAYKVNGEENNDIYLVFKEKPGNWSRPIKIGREVNTNYQEQFPKVSNDMKYIFFTSNRLKKENKINHNYQFSKPLNYKKIKETMNEPGNGKGDIYWVSSKIIEELKPMELK